MYPAIAAFFLVSTLSLLITTVASGHPRKSMYRALAWSASASLASTLAWEATNEPLPVFGGEAGMAFAVQTVFYGCAALALWVWTDMHAVDIEREQRIECWRQESDERNCQIEQRKARLEAEKRADREAEEAREEQERAEREAKTRKEQQRQVEREAEVYREEKERAKREAEAREEQQRQDEHKRKMKQLRDERERRMQEAEDNYNKARKELRERLNYARTTVPDEAKYRELNRVKKEIAACAKDYGVTVEAFRYDKDGERIVIKPQEGGRSLPAEFQEQANRLLDNDDVREIYNHQNPIRQAVKEMKQATGALRWELTSMIP